MGAALPGKSTHGTHLRQRGVGVPGYERQTAGRGHFQAGQRRTCRRRGRTGTRPRRTARARARARVRLRERAAVHVYMG